MPSPTIPRAFVMGHPIAHSRSPMLHGYWLRTLGLPGAYDMVDVPPAELDAFFAALRERGFVGGNITVPHKTAAMAHVARIDDAARQIGAINTIWIEDGDLVGGNTDAFGFLGNLDDRAPGWDKDAKIAVVLERVARHARRPTPCCSAASTCTSSTGRASTRRRWRRISAPASTRMAGTNWPGCCRRRTSS